MGLVILYSTSAYNGEVKFHDSFYYLKKQLFATLLGIAAMFVMAGMVCAMLCRISVKADVIWEPEDSFYHRHAEECTYVNRVYIANDMAYVVARNGDTFQVLGKEFGISWKRLVKYNDLHKEYTLEAGDIIYLKEKRKKAAKPHTVYIVKDGDSMHTISQKYGIRLKNLYKMNRKDAEYVPEVGDRLRLR